MDCGRARDVMLAALDRLPVADGEHDLATAHAKTCAACREFDQAHRALDAALETAILKPALSAMFRHDLRRAIRVSTSSRWDQWLPDIAYLIGALAATLLALLMLPSSGATVAVVAIVGLLGYVFQIAVTHMWQHSGESSG
jgi:hypothetical protein